LTVSNSSLFTPALLRTHSFVFFAVHETRNILLSPFISKASRLEPKPNFFCAVGWLMKNFGGEFFFRRRRLNKKFGGEGGGRIFKPNQA